MVCSGAGKARDRYRCTYLLFSLITNNRSHQNRSSTVILNVTKIHHSANSWMEEHVISPLYPRSTVELLSILTNTVTLIYWYRKIWSPLVGTSSFFSYGTENVVQSYVDKESIFPCLTNAAHLPRSFKSHSGKKDFFFEKRCFDYLSSFC